jgi:hypothetical protein
MNTHLEQASENTFMVCGFANLLSSVCPVQLGDRLILSSTAMSGTMSALADQCQAAARRLDQAGRSPTMEDAMAAVSVAEAMCRTLAELSGAGAARDVSFSPDDWLSTMMVIRQHLTKAELLMRSTETRPVMPSTESMGHGN